MEKTFIRVRSVKDIVISALIIILGSVLIILFEGEGVKIAGFFFLLIGLIVLFVLKSDYKDVDSSITVHFKTSWNSANIYYWDVQPNNDATFLPYSEQARAPIIATDGICSFGN